jgi:gamma-glutamylcyclotransferase (GGCT)/AIG2-like uncharacterized protein YtfP
MSAYIFGYGSLMNSSSRRLTGRTGQAMPVVVSGLVRHWGKVNDHYTASPLVSEIGDGIVNGVLLEIPPAELAEFDRRERGYQRVKLNREQIETDGPLAAEGDVWVYIKPAPEPPCAKAPVLQTYLDTVLSGCLEVSEEFARLFIRYTRGWQAPITNDRHRPQYRNYAGVPQHHQVQIDQLLAQLCY